MNFPNNSRQYEDAIINRIITNASNLSEENLTPGRRNLRRWLGKAFRITISDGRILVGFFNCTDKDANVVLSMCSEYLEEGKEARILGNVMIPGKHIVSVAVDLPPDEVFPDKQQQSTNPEAETATSTLEVAEATVASPSKSHVTDTEAAPALQTVETLVSSSPTTTTNTGS